MLIHKNTQNLFGLIFFSCLLFYIKQKNPHSLTEISIGSRMETATAGDMHSYPGWEPEPGVAQLPDSVPGSPVTPVTKKGKTEPTISKLQNNIAKRAKHRKNNDRLTTLIKKNTVTNKESQVHVSQRPSAASVFLVLTGTTANGSWTNFQK